MPGTRRDPSTDLARVIVDQHVRALYERWAGALGGLHADVAVRETGIELRAEFDGRSLCRVVPYRELLHIQIGDSPVWEVRVRDEDAFLEALDRMLRTFLRLLSERP